MAPKEKFRLFFIPYQKETSDSDKGNDDGDSVSWQKHASREYHKKNKLKKAISARQARSKLSSAGCPQNLRARPLIPRDHTEKEVATVVYSGSQHMPALTNVGGDLFDPFGVAAPSDKPRYAIEMLDHAISQQWPGFDAGSGPSPIKQTILSCAMASPAAFYAVVFAAASHAAFNYTGRDVPVENKMLRMTYKGLALSHLKAELASLIGPASEALMLCIISLAAHGHGDQLVPPPNNKNKLKGPLAMEQHSQFYGEMKWEIAHLTALVSIIKARGGLKTLKLPGLAESIALSDNLTAFKNLQPPTFPLLFPIEQVMSCWPKDELESYCSVPNRTSNFAKLPPNLRAHPLLRTIRYIPPVLAGYREYLNGSRGQPTLVQILSGRNVILHELLSYDPAFGIVYSEHSPCSCLLQPETCNYGEESDPTNATTVDEYHLLVVIRYIMLAFMLLVLFPLPRITGVHDILTVELMQAIDRCNENNLQTTHPELLLYAIVVGGAVADRPSKDFFVEKFLHWESTCLANQHLESDQSAMSEDKLWMHVKKTCVAWLWYDGPYSELEVETTLFWNEVLQRRRKVVTTM